MTLHFTYSDVSDKLKVVREVKMFGTTAYRPVGWLEHDKDDWKSWYFFGADVLLGPKDMKQILEKLEELKNE